MNKTLLSFVKKECLHIIRDPRTLLVAIMIPVVQMIMFGFAISTEVNSIDVAAVVPHPTSATSEALGRLINNPYINYVGQLPTGNEIHTALASNNVMAVVSFSPDYETDGETQIVLDGSNPVIAQTASGYLSGILSGSASNAAPPVRILYNPQLLSSYNFVPGIMGLIFMLICAMLTSVSIVKEKETGTMEILLVSPIKPYMIVLAKLVPYFILALVDLTLILLIARYALGVPLTGSMSALLLLSFIYIALSLSFGLFISTLVDNQMTALLICGMVLIMPATMLSGLMFPIENMPLVLQWISDIIPARWYIASMRKVMIQGLGFEYIWTELAIISGITILLISLTIKRFNNRLN